MSWKLLNRNLVYDTKFLKVYEDKVKLPNGSIIEDYTVIEKPSIVMVVATAENGWVLVLNEYKYAAGRRLLSLPAGHKKDEESPVEAARRELIEETGYTADRFEELGVLRDYPTKDLHKVYVVRALDIQKKGFEDHEETESITHTLVSLADLKEQIKAQKWSASSALAALAYSGILF